VPIVRERSMVRARVRERRVSMLRERSRVPSGASYSSGHKQALVLPILAAFTNMLLMRPSATSV
jgi:hypothetical protein